MRLYLECQLQRVSRLCTEGRFWPPASPLWSRRDRPLLTAERRVQTDASGHATHTVLLPLVEAMLHVRHPRHPAFAQKLTLPEPGAQRAIVVTLEAPCAIRGEVDLADAAFIVSLLFQDGSWQPDAICLDACDTNDDGRVDLADAHAILAWLFLQGSPPPAPFPDLGVDPTDDKLECPIVEDPCPLGREICRPPEES